MSCCGSGSCIMGVYNSSAFVPPGLLFGYQLPHKVDVLNLLNLPILFCNLVRMLTVLHLLRLELIKPFRGIIAFHIVGVIFHLRHIIVICQNATSNKQNPEKSPHYLHPAQIPAICIPQGIRIHIQHSGNHLDDSPVQAAFLHIRSKNLMRLLLQSLGKGFQFSQGGRKTCTGSRPGESPPKALPPIQSCLLFFRGLSFQEPLIPEDSMQNRTVKNRNDTPLGKIRLLEEPLYFFIHPMLSSIIRNGRILGAYHNEVF